MGCIHCGQDVTTEDYTFRFGPEDETPMDVELWVCDICLEVLLTEPDIELVTAGRSASTDDTRSRVDLRDQRHTR